MIVEMLYKEVIVSVLGKESKRYAPYLLTLFFFIFVSNMMGLIAVFPGGANVMGNMSITLVLALCTFVVINVSGTKEYWKEIFWPDGIEMSATLIACYRDIRSVHEAGGFDDSSFR